MIRCICLLLLVTATGTGAARTSNVPPPFMAVYTVHHGIFTVGEARVSFRRPSPGRYVYRSRSRTTGLVSLFRDTRVHERSEGRIIADGFRPRRYNYRRQGEDARTGELRFYWQDGQVVNDVGGHPWRLDIPPGTKDRLVGSLQLMHDLDAGRNTLEYPVADGGRLRTYRFRPAGREILDTSLGELETLRVVRTDDDGDSRTELWCALDLHYLPVRIEHSDPAEGDYSMTLESVDFEPRTDAD